MSEKIDLENHPFGDGLYRFHLGLSAIHAIQEKTGDGIGGVYRRTLTGVYVVDGNIMVNPIEADFKHEHIEEIIRQALIGGNFGMLDDREITVGPIIANRLVKTYVTDRSFDEGWTLAATIMMARMVGYEPAKKKEQSANNGKTTVDLTSS